MSFLNIINNYAHHWYIIGYGMTLENKALVEFN